jgi:hypothetical protein
VLPGAAAARSYSGPLSAGTVVASVAPAGDWSLTTASGPEPTRRATTGWAPSFHVPVSTTGTLRFDGGPLPLLSGLWSAVAWGLAVTALIDRRRIRRRLELVGRTRARAAGRARRSTVDDEAWDDDGMVPS